MIHCIGDSHAAFFSGQNEMQPVFPHRSNDVLPWFRSYRIGPATAYQLHTKQQTICDILDQVLAHGDSVMFCFGEVDIRAHLVKRAKQEGLAFDVLAEECVDRYVTALLHYSRYNVPVLVWGPIATWRDEAPYDGPSYGTHTERNQMTAMFNDRLRVACPLAGYKFVSIFEDMVDGMQTKPGLLDDWDGSHIHLSPNALPLVLNLFRREKIID